MINFDNLKNLNIKFKNICRNNGIKGYSDKKKNEIIELINSGLNTNFTKKKLKSIHI